MSETEICMKNLEKIHDLSGDKDVLQGVTAAKVRKIEDAYNEKLGKNNEKNLKTF